uniref:Uncharacterized protein n=1 Tax=Plectus sambesii TaxID=2011161 RepID=A0A914VHN3_9BILA
MAQLRLEEQPRLLQSLAVEAYRKAFNQELPKPEMPAVFREEHGEIAQASGSTSFLGSQLRGPGLLGGVPPTPSGGGSSINSNISTNNRGSYSNSMTFTNVARPYPAAPAYHIPSLLNLRHSAPPGYGPVLGSRTASIRGGYLHPSAPHRYPRARWAGRPY